MVCNHNNNKQKNTPRSIGRGPVEASNHALYQLEFPLTPRSIGRGPVEAGSRFFPTRKPQTPLRAQLGAAPLKRGDVPALMPIPQNTPRSIGRGPVEAAITSSNSLSI